MFEVPKALSLKARGGVFGFFVQAARGSFLGRQKGAPRQDSHKRQSTPPSHPRPENKQPVTAIERVSRYSEDVAEYVLEENTHENFQSI